MQMIQEFADIVALPYDPVNHISISRSGEKKLFGMHKYKINL